MLLPDPVLQKLNWLVDEFVENGYPFDARACCGYFLAMGNASPIRGVDYPRTFDEMDEWYRRASR